MSVLRRLQKGLDTVSTAISGVMLAVMMVILAYNVFARFLGGGITWYMESAQYLNVWAELIAGIGLCAMGQHLRITALEEAVGGIAALKGAGRRVVRVIVDLSIIAFYLFYAYGNYLLASRSRQAISTMAAFKMKHVYIVIPVICLFCVFATIIHLIIDMRGDENKEAAA